MSDVELSFEIGAYSPQTFPMERLGKYISDIGAMLGEEQFVQFVALEAGSTKIVHRVKAPAVASVEQRIANLAAGVEKIKEAMMLLMRSISVLRKITPRVYIGVKIRELSFLSFQASRRKSRRSSDQSNRHP